MSSKHARLGTRGRYVSQACTFCRRRKTRCDGRKPLCGPCHVSGHECGWGEETAKRPSTKPYVESLRNRIKSLETELARYRKKFGNLDDDLSSTVALWHAGSSVPASSHLTLDDTEGTELISASDPDEDIYMPVKLLVLEDDDFRLYGPTSIFRLASRKPQRVSRLADIATTSTEIYTLLVGDIDESYCDPNFDYSRYLPTQILLTRKEHDRLLDLMFKFFTSWCLRIVPVLFLRDMWRVLSAPHTQPPPKATHYSPMLHNALLALATAFSDDPGVHDIDARQFFAQKAKSYIERECQSPNISVVHGLALLGTFHACQGDPTMGYLYFGMSGSMSQALGLSVDCSSWVKAGLISREDMLDRNWAYWTTFSADVCWYIFVGRDFSISLPSDFETIPVPFVDSGFDNLPWFYPPSNMAPQANNLSRTFGATCELLMIARRIMEFLNSLTDPVARQSITLEQVSRIDVELQEWKEQLPPEIDITPPNRQKALPHRIMLHLTYWWLFLLLHQPFYRRSQFAYRGEQDIDHVKLCTRATDNIMELLHTWRSLYTLRFIPITLVQVVFSAGTIFVLSAAHAISGSRLARVTFDRSILSAELCIQYLSETGKSWACANHAMDILKDLLHKQVSTNTILQSIHHTIPAIIPHGDPASSTLLRSGDVMMMIAPAEHVPAPPEVVFPFTSLASPSPNRHDYPAHLGSAVVCRTAVQVDYSVVAQRARDYGGDSMTDSVDRFGITDLGRDSPCMSVISASSPFLTSGISRSFAVDGHDPFQQTYTLHHLTENETASLIELLQDEQQHFG